MTAHQNPAWLLASLQDDPRLRVVCAASGLQPLPEPDNRRDSHATLARPKAHQWPVASTDVAMICILAIWTSPAPTSLLFTHPKRPRSNPQAGQGRPRHRGPYRACTLAWLAWATLS